MQAVRIVLDDDVLPGLQRTPEELAGELRLAAAVKWHEMGTVSQEKAARIAGLNRGAFSEALGRFGVSPFQESSNDVLAAVQDV